MIDFFTFQVRWNWNKTTLASLSDPHGMPSAHIKQIKCLRVQEGKCILIITASDKYSWKEIGGRRQGIKRGVGSVEFSPLCI